MAGLRRRHLDFTHGRIVIEDGKTHGSVREVHISPFLREELLVYVADLKLAVCRARCDAPARGDSSCRPRSRHTLRRTFVTLSAQAGRSASWVQAKIGTPT